MSKRCLKTISIVAISLLLCLLLILSPTKSDSPSEIIEEDITPQEQVIYDFYQAVSYNNCLKALELRPGYPEQHCQKASKAKIINLTIEKETDNITVILLEITYQGEGTPKSFLGYVTLIQQNGKWIILDNSYKQAKHVTLQKYLDDTLKFSSILFRNETSISPSSSPTVIPSLPFSNTTSIHELVFGSQGILNSCWTQEELQGNPQDKKVIRPLQRPDRNPPERKSPVYQEIPLASELRGSIRSVHLSSDTGKKLVALTFDLCERMKEKTGYDAAIVNYLRENNVRATFYAGGKWMRSHPEKTLQLMADPLFEIGNHAWTHGNLRMLNNKEMKEQILWTQAQYELLWEDFQNRPCATKTGMIEFSKIPRIPLTFRFPYGTCNQESLNMLALYGLPAIQWNIVTADPVKGQTAKMITHVILKNITPGSIIIAHANRRGYNTSKALPLFIPKLRDELGYQFVTMTELLSAGKAIAVDTCYELKPNDNLKYDEIFGKGIE